MTASPGVGYRYLDHDADVCIVGCGDTLEEAFEAAAAAMFALMAADRAMYHAKRTRGAYCFSGQAENAGVAQAAGDANPPGTGDHL